MLRILASTLCCASALLVASPSLAADFGAAPDPGWYQQGSGYLPDERPGRRRGVGDAEGGGYGGDAFGRDRGFRYGGDEPPSAWNPGGGAFASGWHDGRQPARYATPPASGDPPPQRRSPDGYGAPDWAQQPLPQARSQTGATAPGWRDDWTFERQPWLPDDGYDAAGQDVWRVPPARPRYRFREDPDLEQRMGEQRLGGYRFRPLTDKERARQREAEGGAWLAEPYPEGRYRPQERRRDGGGATAFGYAPESVGSPPEDFYRRYYRSGP